ncbi:MAG TPA: hypothetical protein VGK24_09545 [Candidatus Angelobacter sp.]|jgi:hypothetical protein
MTIVNALNALHGALLLVFVVLFVAILIFARYRNHPPAPAGTLVDVINSVHPAVYGFALCVMAYTLMLIGHGSEGEKVFLSGASFIGGVALRGAYNPGGKDTPAAAAVTSPLAPNGQ